MKTRHFTIPDNRREIEFLIIVALDVLLVTQKEFFQLKYA